MVKVLQLLLIARVLAAPVALRPAEGDSHWQTLVVARACAWAAHQSQIGVHKIDEGQKLEAVAPLPACHEPVLRSLSPATADCRLILLPGDAPRSPARLRC